ncbi:MAG: hypothetical protein ACE5IL_13160, partial [Myxococcota bacterium]
MQARRYRGVGVLSAIGWVLLCLAPGRPALAQVTSEAPYQGIGIGARNNVIDVSALGACTLAGCRDVDGNLCAPDQPCNLERVPAGRCSRGTNPGCLWPLGAGFCTSDPNRGCLANPDCPNLDCDLTFNDPNCACQGSDSTAPNYETNVCGGSGGVCSDGDDDPNTPFEEFREGSDGGGCIEINIFGPSQTNCGFEGGDDLSGPRSGLENPPIGGTPQRRPGEQGQDIGEVVDVRATSVNGFSDPNAITGVRRIVTFGDSTWGDWTYSNKLLSGAPVSSTGGGGTPCLLPGGWTPGDPVQTGTCRTGGAVCASDRSCGANGPCDGLSFCHSPGIAQDQVSFLWTDPAFDPNTSGATTCPPRCGTTYDLNTFEQEALNAAASADRRAGIQLGLDSLGPPFARFGDFVAVASSNGYTWIGDPDVRCFINGRDDAQAAAGWVGRCEVGSAACNPETGAIDPNGGGGTCSCRRCNTHVDFVPNCSVTTTQLCQVDADCPATEACLKTATSNLPPDFNDHGFPQISANHRVGGLNGSSFTIAVPLVVLLTTGDVAAEFRDNDVKAFSDSRLLGPVTTGTGGIGIGAGRTFTNGVTTFAAFPGETCCSSGADILVSPDNPGLPGGALMRSYEWASGADRIPGCIGDTSKAVNGPFALNVGVCNDTLGDGMRGSTNTGADDVILEAAPAGCELTCIGEEGPTRGFSCTSDANCDAGLNFCRCGGMSAARHGADALPNPAAPFPTLRVLVAGSLRDLSVSAANNTDTIFKGLGVSCPYVGSCTTGGEQCARSADCANPGDTCDNIALSCAAAITDPCATLGGDTDGDGICDDGDGSG